MSDKNHMQDKKTAVRDHFRKHKKKYLIGAGIVVGFVVGAAIGYAAAPAIKATRGSATAVQNVKALKVGDVTQNVTQVVARRGHPGFLIKCNETGEQFASIRRTADLLGLNRVELYKHLKGEIPSINGMTFTNLGEAK